MYGETNMSSSSLAERATVRRLRLLSDLEGAGMNTIFLVAPAGYGKDDPRPAVD